MHEQDLVRHYATIPVGTSFVRPVDVLHLLQSQPIPAKPRIFDVGCGQGQLVIALAQAWPDAEIIAIDLSPEQIAKARQAAAQAGINSIQFGVANWRDFDLPCSGIDIILATQVIQFMPDEHAFVEYLADALALDGQLLLRSVLLPEEEPGRSFVEQVVRQWIDYSIRFYSERNLSELLRECGLSRLRIDKEEMWLDTLSAERQTILNTALRQHGFSLDDVQQWFWAGTIAGVRR
ncbi:class I SAM-dependent methyltransferase [Herpetosiphon giganteus]|uniref:class I SAM-dependent methyltransferase n=1 Tax=Herpetosiphon giganteus TaxID=2029754 RepID=UPI001956686A|nr:class I SAM-dependent methyltransferase [Herpetosiphon giganteus]MBM7843366.1 cyclopropane fatty-acyl-phospholipid synthase-like methyltransferase [Herpetosiphon giganteus]